MIEIILTYASMWAPALVAILGIVASVIFAIAKVKNALNELRTQEMKDNLAALVKQNAELTQVNKLLTDKLAKIQGYTNSVLGNDDH